MTSFLPSFIEEVVHGVEVVRKASRGREPQISWIDALFLFLYCLHTGLAPSKIAPAIGIANSQNLITAIARIRPLLHRAIDEVMIFFPKDQVRANLAIRDPQAPLQRFNNIVAAVDSTTIPIHKPQVSLEIIMFLSLNLKLSAWVPRCQKVVRYTPSNIWHENGGCRSSESSTYGSISLPCSSGLNLRSNNSQRRGSKQPTRNP